MPHELNSVYSSVKPLWRQVYLREDAVTAIVLVGPLLYFYYTRFECAHPLRNQLDALPVSGEQYVAEYVCNSPMKSSGVLRDVGVHVPWSYSE